jgi:hypothetical protein
MLLPHLLLQEQCAAPAHSQTQDLVAAALQDGAAVLQLQLCCHHAV